MCSWVGRVGKFTVGYSRAHGSFRRDTAYCSKGYKATCLSDDQRYASPACMDKAAQSIAL